MSWLTKSLQKMKQEVLKSTKSSIPAKVLAFNPSSQIAQVQIVMESVRQTGESYPIPLLECPVVQAGDNNFFVETQISKGSEGILFFSQRCFDAWFQSGEVSRQNIIRFHNLNDCYFMAGLRSKPNIIQNHSNNGIKLRSKDDSQYIWLKNDGTGHIKLNNLVIDGDVEHNGDFNLNGDHTTNGNQTINGDLEQTGTATNLQASAINLTGATTVAGSLTVAGALAAQGAMQVSGSMTGGQIACNDVVVNGTSLKDHTHSSGGYKDAEIRPINGSSGGMN